MRITDSEVVLPVEVGVVISVLHNEFTIEIDSLSLSLSDGEGESMPSVIIESLSFLGIVA